MFTNKKVLNFFFVLSILFSLLSTTPAKAEENPVTIDIVHQGETTVVTVHGAWSYCMTVDPMQTSTEVIYPDYILTFVGIDYGKILIYEGGSCLQLIQTVIWSRQWFTFHTVPDHILSNQKTSLAWGRNNSGQHVTFTTVVPAGIVIPFTECASGEGCFLENYFGENPGFPSEGYNLYNVSALSGNYIITSTFTETVSGFTITVTDTLTVVDPFNYLYLPLVTR